MKEADDALKVIAKGAGIFSIGLIVSKLLGYVYRFIIAWIGPEQYGLFSIALAVFGIAGTISMLGMNEGVVRFVSVYKGKLDERRIKGVITSALKINITLGVGIGLFLFFLSDWIAITFFHDLKVSILLKILAFALPLDVLRNVFFSAIRAFQRADYETYSKSIAENVAKVILTLIAVYLGFDIIGVAFAYLFSIAISFAFSFYFLEKKVFPIIKTSIVSLKNYKELSFYSVPLLLSSITFMIIQWSDTLMLGYFKTPSDVGVYNVAFPLAYLTYLFPQAIRTLFFPVLSGLYAQDKIDMFKKVYRTVVNWNILISLPLFIFLVAFPSQIIRFLFGEVYIADSLVIFGESIPIASLTLIILTFGIAFPHFLVPATDVMLVLKRTKLIFFNTIFVTVLNIALNFFLIPQYGIIGTAIATASAHFVRAIMVLIESYALTKINPFKISSFKALLITTFILIFIYTYRLYTITNILYIILVGFVIFAIYSILLFLTKSFEKEDLIILKSIKEKLRVNLDFIGLSKKT